MPLGGNDDTPAGPGARVTVECGPHRWQVRSEFADAACFLDHLAHPAALLEPPAQPLKPFASLSPRTIVRRVFRELPDRPVIIKRYRPKSRIGNASGSWSNMSTPANARSIPERSRKRSARCVPELPHRRRGETGNTLEPWPTALF